MTYRYVVGFAFTPTRQAVLLIRKNRPRWQAGYLNGLGGSLRDGETYEAAMVRKFKEESGLDTTEADWGHFLTITGSDYQLRCFMTTHPSVAHTKESPTDEALHVVAIHDIPNLDVVSNLQWMIPMALDRQLERPVEIPDYRLRISTSNAGVGGSMPNLTFALLILGLILIFGCFIDFVARMVEDEQVDLHLFGRAMIGMLALLLGGGCFLAWLIQTYG